MNETKRRQIKDYLEQSRELSPALLDAEGHVSRGNAYYALDDYEAALEEFSAALAERPTYVNAQFNLGGVFLKVGRFAEAEVAFLAAIGLAAAQGVLLPEAYYYLGVALVEQKRYLDALDAATRATERGGDPEFMYLRARLHAMQPQPQTRESAEWLRRAIAARPRYRDLAREDAAFQAVRDAPEFRALLDKSA